MLRSFRRAVAPLSVALLLMLAACGNRQAAAPTEAPAAPTEAPAPTRTPRPTREPTATPEPAPTAEPTAEATAVVLSNDTPTSDTSGKLQPVDIGDLETYKHSSGVFQIDVPKNWTLQDNSKADELILIWTDPTRNGGVIVDIYEDAKTNAAKDLTATLKKYLTNTFGSQPDFTMEDPKTQQDESVLIVWTYTATADNGVKAELLGNTFIEQRGNKVSLLSTLVPSDQFTSLKEKTNAIINAYSITPDAPIKQ